MNNENGILSLIVKTFDFIEQDSFILMYKALIRQHVEYGNTLCMIWYPHWRRVTERVERLGLPGYSSAQGSHLRWKT